VVSMVPAAPLLPAIEPDSAVEAQRDEPAVVLVPAPDVEVEVDLVVVVVDLPVDGGAAVDAGGDELDEQALSRTPPATATATEAANTPAALDDLLGIGDPSRLFPGARTPLDRTTPPV